MSRKPTLTPLPAYLTDPAWSRWRAAQKIACRPGPWERIPGLPEGEVIWQEAADNLRYWVVLTADVRLVLVQGDVGETLFYAKGAPATEEWVAAIRG